MTAWPLHFFFNIDIIFIIKHFFFWQVSSRHRSLVSTLRKEERLREVNNGLFFKVLLGFCWHYCCYNMRLGDRNCKDDLDPLKKLLVIAAGAQRRSLHYWGAHNITEGFFFLVLLCSSSSSRGLSLLSSCNRRLSLDCSWWTTVNLTKDFFLF